MKHMRMHIFSSLLVLILVLGLTGFVYADVQQDYVDVDRESWYYEPVDFVTALGVMNGVGGGKFDPNSSLTRAMTVTILYRMAGAPDVSDVELSFKDVPAGSWYEDPIKWAYLNEITRGTSNTTFSPHRLVTREQLACLLVRYCKSIGADFLNEGPFAAQYWAEAEQATTSAYALEDMQMMILCGFYQGNGHGYFSPKATATRAEAAAVFCRLAKRLQEYPTSGKLLLGQNCLDMSFDNNSNEAITLSTEDTGWLYECLTTKSSDWTSTEALEFEVCYRLYFWGTEYQFPASAEICNGYNIVTKDGSVYGKLARQSEVGEVSIRLILYRMDACGLSGD